MYVASGSASLLLDFIDQQQLPLSDLRQRLLQLESTARIAAPLWWALLEEIQAAHPVPALGLAIGRCACPRHVGVLGYIALYCDTAAQALLRFNRFEPLLHNLAPSQLSMEGEDVVIRWTQRSASLLSDEVIAAGLIAMARRLTGDDSAVPARVAFAHPAPADTRPYEHFFGAAASFGNPTLSIRVPARCMTLPVDSRDPWLVQLLEQQAQALLDALPRADAFLQQVQEQIVAVLQDGPPDLRRVAPRLGLSERSLYRQLGERGLRYKAVLAAVRYELARKYLENPHLTLAQIALMLGFSGQSAFSRAFRSWSGQAPLRYRQQRNA